jgi:diguanylate cyclase (GGDEF)-like protein
MASVIGKLGRIWATIAIAIISVIIGQACTQAFILCTGQTLTATGRIVSVVNPFVAGLILGWIGVGIILKMKKLERDLHESATYDSLTKLLNRTSLLDNLSSLISLMKREKMCLGLLYIDIDHFKDINNAHGNAIGDLVIQYCASTMKAKLRASDVVGRIGGEEFVVGLPNVGMDGGIVVGEKIRKAIAAGKAIVSDSLSIKVTVSIGLAVYRPSDEVDVDRLIVAADRELSTAKKAGRNRICFEEQIFGGA